MAAKKTKKAGKRKTKRHTIVLLDTGFKSVPGVHRKSKDMVRFHNQSGMRRTVTIDRLWPFENPPSAIILEDKQASGWYVLLSSTPLGPRTATLDPMFNHTGGPGDPVMSVGD